MNRKSEIIVVDTGGFIENAKLQDYGEKIYTVAAVIDEIRDKNTRRRLQVLPYEICYREPCVESISEVRKAATETGDLRSLSATDIKIIALTYELHKELASGATVSHEDQEKDDESIIDESDGEMDVEKDEIEENPEASSDTHEVEEQKDDLTAGEVETNDDVSEEEGESSDDDANWVTSENISSVDFEKHFQTGKDDDKEKDLPTPAVSCLTTDFAMQNVMLKLDLSIRGVNGRLVRSVKSFVLWCFSCFSHTLDQSKVFCPKCGNNTLRKVSASANANGKLQLHFSKKFQIRNKGLNRQVDSKYQGGKYSFNKIYSADQPMPHQRPSKKALQREAQSEGVVCSDNPFALRDLSSRAARIGMNKRNRTRCRK